MNRGSRFPPGGLRQDLQSGLASSIEKRQNIFAKRFAVRDRHVIHVRRLSGQYGAILPNRHHLYIDNIRSEPFTHTHTHTHTRTHTHTDREREKERERERERERE